MAHRRILWGGLGLIFALIGGVAPAASQTSAQPGTPGYTPAELQAYQQAKGKEALDEFVAKYPDSTLLPNVYRAYYLTYWESRDYSNTILYLDKLLALRDKIDVGMRLEALVARAQAFVAGCGNPSFQTAEAYAKARDAATDGVRTMNEWQKPPDLTDDQFTFEKKSAAILFSAAGMAESGLGNAKIDACKPGPAVIAGAAPDPGRFDRMINEILREQRESPRVR